MGLSFSSLFDKFTGKKEYKTLMLGLDGAGKSTLLYSLKLGEVIHTVPTIGFNMEEIKYKSVTFSAWDVGGQDKIRRLWRHYFAGTEAIIFVVDSADKKRMPLARKELEALMSEDSLREASLLVFANKQDMPGAMSSAKMAEELGLHKLRGRDWFIQGCCATSGDGLHAGLDWMVTALKGSK